MNKNNRVSAGITLVEILVATTILAFTIGPIIAMFSFASRNIGSSVHRVQAQFMAHAVLESLRAEITRFPRAADSYPWRFEVTPVKLGSYSFFDRSNTRFFNNVHGPDKPIDKDSPLFEELSPFKILVDFSGSRGVRMVKVTVNWRADGKDQSLELTGSIEVLPWKFVRKESYR